jgi:hypothetical protein
MKAIIALILAALLAACTVTPTTPAQTIYQVESDYNAAAQIIIAYKALPSCALANHPLACSSLDVIAKLKAADTVAYNAIVAAENTARTAGAGANAATALVAAQQATQALTSITSTLNIH